MKNLLNEVDNLIGKTWHKWVDSIYREEETSHLPRKLSNVATTGCYKSVAKMTEDNLTTYSRS